MAAESYTKTIKDYVIVNWFVRIILLNTFETSISPHDIITVLIQLEDCRETPVLNFYRNTQYTLRKIFWIWTYLVWWISDYMQSYDTSIDILNVDLLEEVYFVSGQARPWSNHTGTLQWMGRNSSIWLAYQWVRLMVREGNTCIGIQRYESLFTLTMQEYSQFDQ